MAVEALRVAARPPGADARTVALALGILAYPCAEEDSARLVGAEPHRFRFSWSDDRAVRDRRVYRGLAWSLLLRSGVAHDVGDVDALAEALRRPKEKSSPVRIDTSAFSH